MEVTVGCIEHWLVSIENTEDTDTEVWGDTEDTDPEVWGNYEESDP